MKANILMTMIGLFLCSPLMADITIDNFTSGATKMRHKCGIADRTKKARTPGRYRWIRLQVNKPPKCKAGNPNSQFVTANLRNRQLRVINGKNVRSRTEIHYGRNHRDRKFPMNLDLTEGTKKPGYLEVTFSRATAGLNLNVGVIADNGPKRASCGVNVPPSSRSFTVAFPLAKFRMVNGMRAKDFNDADFMSLIIQTTGNFGIKRIKSTLRPKRSSIKASC